MPTYIVLGKYTEEGIEKIKESPERLQKAREVVKQLGGEIKEFYYTMGQYDFVAITEGKDNETTMKALFAIGEYYFLIGDYYDAERTFRQFVNDYPEEKGMPFALVYLFEIAKRQRRKNQAEDLKKQILDLRQRVFLFKDFKEHKYLSPFAKKYRIIYFIDRLEVYIDNELFTEAFF